jgi:L-ribulose-5-phosphate 4-epimerase
MLLEELRQEVVSVGRMLHAEGLVTLTWGNLSARDPNSGLVAIKPSGMFYHEITAGDVVVLSPEGTVVDGARKPSSETPMHLHIYRSRPEVMAVVHTHSPYATAIGVLCLEIPLVIGELANAVGGAVRTAAFASEGTEELGRSAVKALEGRNAVLLQNHGVVTVGPDLRDAFFSAVVTEDAARVFWLARSIGKPTVIPDEEAARLHEEFVATYGQK